MALNKCKTECILQAAAEVFSRDGFSVATMDAIAHEAGVSKATLYTHFAGKTELFSTAAHEATDRFVLELDEEQLILLPLEAALLKMAKHYISFLFSEPTLAFVRAVIGEAGRNPELGQHFYQNGPELGRKGILSFFSSHPELSHIPTSKYDSLAIEFVTLIKGDWHFKALLGMPYLESELACHIDTAIKHFILITQSI